MTIATSTSSTTAQGNGVTTLFAYAFLMPSASDLIVTVTNSSSVSAVIPSNQFIVTGIGNPLGGTVTYPLTGSPLPAGSYITIARVLPLQQLVTIANQGNFYPQATEQALDALEMQIQQEAFAVSRAIVVNPADTALPPPLPIASVRANMVLGFDGSGNPLLYSPTGAAATNAANVTYAPPFSNSVSRSVATRLADWKSVKDFGATGDGATDDTVAINHALGTGGAIWFPPGTYVISADMVAPFPNTTIACAPDAVHISASNAATFTHSMLVLQGSNTAVLGIGFLGNFDNGTLDTQDYSAVYFHGVSNIVLRDLSITGVTNSAINVPCTSSSETTTNLSINNVNINNVGWIGVYLASCYNVSISDSSVVTCGSSCVYLDYFSTGTGTTTSCSGVRISNFYGNRASAPDHIRPAHTEDGFLFGYVAGTGPLTIADSIFIDNSRLGAAYAGIGVVTDGVNLPLQITVTGCTVTKAAGYGIQAVSSAQIANNTIVQASLAGIFVGGNSLSFSDVILTGNSIVNTQAVASNAYGILIQGMATTSAFSSVIASGNIVIDGQAPKQTLYGAFVVYTASAFANVSFIGNQFTAVLTAAFGSVGAEPSPSGISSAYNLGTGTVAATGGTIDATFYQSFLLTQSSATSVTKIINGFPGQAVVIQAGDTHSTFLSGTASGNFNFTAGSGTVTASLHQSAIAILGANGLWATVFS